MFLALHPIMKEREQSENCQDNIAKCSLDRILNPTSRLSHFVRNGKEITHRNEKINTDYHEEKSK